MRISAAALPFMLALLIVGCGSDDDGQREPTATAARSSTLPQGSEPVRLDPSDFTTNIDNRFWPMTPGSRWVYRETGEEGGEQRDEVTVTGRTKKIAGVTARVVHDVVTQRGELVEDTFDWYAQDKAGNIWYLGEDTREYENGKVSTTEGSWQAGVDGAQAGVMMPARPRIGVRYRQEYYAGEAEDRAEVLALDGRVQVPAGRFAALLVTRDTNPLGGPAERKSYAKDVGLVRVVTPGGHRQELLRFDRGSR